MNIEPMPEGTGALIARMAADDRKAASELATPETACPAKVVAAVATGSGSASSADDWKNIATSAANKLHAAVLEKDRLTAALEEIESNCSLNGFPEDAPEQVATIAGIVARALGSTTSRQPSPNSKTCHGPEAKP